ncbi:hypothetical protein F0919_14530 [Taibaiella lutea]|uniref:Uncharacterized protein n=1 Tax=Taibaiella lutea TaxID=2608001 RepID=A0A5M6CK79_9BACT|nr:hypothetical protein [Taibaiella lutea]KAA5533745.1 hypothetical protein F0919_14530 [Taibaiella lutea]
MKHIQFDDTIIGEPSLSFSVDKDNFVNLWIGTFNSLMKYAKPNKDGYWDELSLHYQMHDGFYEEPNWKVPSTESYLNCIADIVVPGSDMQTMQTKENIIRLFEYALTEKLIVAIDYN